MRHFLVELGFKVHRGLVEDLKRSVVERARKARNFRHELDKIGKAISCAGVDRQGRKGSEFKVRLASKLRAETTMTLGWIAERLHMGTRGHLTHLLYRHDQTATCDSNQGRLWE